MKTYILLIAFLVPIALFGQKRVDLDRFNFNTQLRDLPLVRLDSTYCTYNVSVEGTKLMRNYLSEMTPERLVFLDGWKKLDQDGHVSFKVKLEDLLPESFSVKERVEIKKDKAGVIIGQKSFYYQEVIYTFAATAEAVDYKGASIIDFVLADRSNKQVYKSPEFPIRQLAEGYFMMSALTITGQLYRNAVNRAMDYLSNSATNNFGFGQRNVSDFMWIVGSKKHPEYMAHRKAFLDIQEVMFTITADKSLEGVRERLQPAIKYFESIKKNYATSSKHDRKLRYASYYNLAKIYYYLDDPQTMMKEASGLVLNDFDASDGKSLAQSAAWLKELFDRTQRTSRHFPIDIASFKGPYENTVSSTKNK